MPRLGSALGPLQVSGGRAGAGLVRTTMGLATPQAFGRRDARGLRGGAWPAIHWRVRPGLRLRMSSSLRIQRFGVERLEGVMMDGVMG